jgi:hypothetical protein
MGQITYFNSSSVVPSTSMGQLVEKPRYGLAFSALKIEIGSPESHGQHRASITGSAGERSDECCAFARASRPEMF